MTARDKQERRCVECKSSALVRFTWLTSTGANEADFCIEHACDWQKKWGGTPAGETLSIFSLDGGQQ